MLGIFLLVGCSSQYIQPSSTAMITPNLPPVDFQTNISLCRDYRHKLDRIIDTQGVRDTQAVAIEGFPFLRINRFLLAVGHSIDMQDDLAFSAWLKHLTDLEAVGRQLELSNLAISMMPT